MAGSKKHREDLLYPELSYKVVGVLFETYKTLGHGYLEKYYQKAVSTLLLKEGIQFEEQVKMEVKIDGEVIATGKADFVIESKIILELKKGNAFKSDNISQVHSYLKASGLRLCILANFTAKGVVPTRIVNIK
jgi:GxxExxY protein